MAPEAITRRQYGKASDIWSAGIMLHILLSGRLPFIGSGRRLQESVLRGRVMVSRHSKRLKLRKGLDEEGKNWTKPTREREKAY